MLAYTPGETIVHRLDPRSKILFQIGFAIAAFARPTWPWLGAVTLLGVCCVLLAGLSIRRALRAYWFVLLVLALGPVLAAVTLGSPWLRVEPALDSLRSVARVVPVLFVSAAFIYSTPVRETRGAIPHSIPGRVGQLLGVGVALTVRFIPVVRRDLHNIRSAIAVRGGDSRSVRDRAGRISTLSVVRALDHADRLSLALQARCFAWNPTLPKLEFTRIDYPVLACSLLLALTPLLWRVRF
jgi:biotin transport system permease protein